MASTAGTVAESRAAASDVAFLGALFVVFLGEAGFFMILFDATTFFIGVVVTTAGCLVGIATMIFVSGVAALGFLVGVDALMAPFLVGVEAMIVSFLGVRSSVGVGLLLGSELLCWEWDPSWE